MADQLRQKHNASADDQQQVHRAQYVEPSQRDFALVGGRCRRRKSGNVQSHFKSPISSRETDRRSPASPCRNSRRSPGWQASASQIAASVEKRIARALPVLRIERLASVIPTWSASSVSVIRRSWSRSSSLTVIAMSHGSFEVFAHVRAFREHAGQHERENDREPP